MKLPNNGISFDWMNPMGYSNQRINNSQSLISGITDPARPMSNGGGDGPSLWGSFLGENGWGGLALGGAQSLMGGYLGMQQLGMAKDQLSENKRQFNMNWGAQKGLANSQLEDRQRQRVRTNSPGAVPVDEYMSQYGVK